MAKYKRVLLKLSGESLMGEKQYYCFYLVQCGPN